MTPEQANRYWSKVDTSSGPDGCWPWLAYSCGRDPEHQYGRFYMERTTVKYAHQVSYEDANGPVSANQHLDHICQNTLCVNPEHIRPVSIKQNIENRTRLNGNNTSGYRGVTWSAFVSRWSAVVKHNRATLFLGRYSDVKEAAEAARIGRKLLYTNPDLDQLQESLVSPDRAAQIEKAVIVRLTSKGLLPK